jgi:prepilin-type N-terminal cleavage/methylation domain-containing protein
MCTTEARAPRAAPRGFTAIELLLGLTLAVVLALAIMPLTVGLEGLGTREADRTIAVLQGRVAAARLERDLRLATAGGSPFPVDSAILQATPWQIVFLGSADDDTKLDLVEWEFTEGRLMRRWGECPEELPEGFAHSLFRDSKTVLEGLHEGEPLSYVVNGGTAKGPIAQQDLCRVEAVVLRVEGEDAAGVWPQGLLTVARVGR